MRLWRKAGPPTHVTIVGRTGRPERIALTETPWWEEAEEKARKQLAHKGTPLRIATFDC